MTFRTSSNCSRQLTKFAGTAPRAIAYRPLSNQVDYKCHQVVEEHVRLNGGTQVFGWLLAFDLPGYSEFQFHSAWQSPEGELVDVVPNNNGNSRTIFARDLKRHPSGDFDGYNNLVFVDSRQILTSLHQFELISNLQLRTLSWFTNLTVKPLTESGRYRPWRRNIDVLKNDYGLDIQINQTGSATIANLPDMTINQLREIEYKFNINTPQLCQLITVLKNNWRIARGRLDVPLKQICSLRTC